MINIVIPIAAKRFIDENEPFQYPLPLIEINGKTLIEYTLEGLQNIKEEVSYIFILNEDDCNKYHFDNTLRLLKPNCIIIKIKGNTKGAICSVLMSIDQIKKESELLILNYDQYINEDLGSIINEFRRSDSDGGVISFNSVHPRWSFVKVFEGKVLQTAEKNPISNFAIAGFYYFKNTNVFIESAFDVIKYDENFEGRYYTSSVYNQMILRGLSVNNYSINKTNYYSFYSSQKVKEFENYLLKR